MQIKYSGNYREEGHHKKMQRGIHRKLTYEDKFGRKYYCCLNNHTHGLMKLKRENRKSLRRTLKSMLHEETCEIKEFAEECEDCGFCNKDEVKKDGIYQ